MAKLSLGNYRLTFGPDSAIVKHIKAQATASNMWQVKDDQLTLEFDLDPNAPLTPKRATYIASLIRARSQSTAESMLKGLSYSLRMNAEFDVPRYMKLMLADALDRVIEDGGSVQFLCGKQDRRGRPSGDPPHDFFVLSLVEQIHASGEPYSPGVGHDGAYYIASELLEQMGFSDVGEDEIRRKRDKVLKKASEDLQYFHQLLHYLEYDGYTISQP